MAEQTGTGGNLTPEEIQRAWTFAIERLSNENRTFWTRLSALLLGNSFLVAGFASLYASNNPNDTLLLTIAAAGIFIQAMWPVFAILSYSTNHYLIKLTMDIEKYMYPDVTNNQSLEKEDIENRVRRIWTHYAKHFWSTFGSKRSQPEKSPNGENPPEHKSLFNKIKVWFKKYVAGLIATFRNKSTEGFKKYPAGFIANLLFLIAFLAIWIAAAAVVNVCWDWRIMTIGISLAVFLIISILCIYIWIKTKDETIQAVR